MQVTLEIVHNDILPSDEQNTTETAKTFKVNCDKRNITGMDNFTVQVLNASQVSVLPCHAPQDFNLCFIQMNKSYLNMPANKCRGFNTTQPTLLWLSVHNVNTTHYKQYLILSQPWQQAKLTCSHSYPCRCNGKD